MPDELAGHVDDEETRILDLEIDILHTYRALHGGEMTEPKILRLSIAAEALERLGYLEERVTELEKALEESGWIYFQRRNELDAAESRRETSTRIISRGSDAGEGGGE